MFKSIRQYLSWDESYIFEEICEVFTVVTVINSFMMVAGIDSPKSGEFAYIHLMGRLLIISAIILIFDFSYIVKEMRTIIKSIKSVLALSAKDVGIGLFQTIIRKKISTISTVFTLLVLILCLINISIIQEPKGDSELYFSLLILWGTITISVFLIWLLDKILKANK